MHTHRSAALQFAYELSNPNFKITHKKRYESRSGWPGVRWEAELNGRPIYGSENRTTVPTPPSELARILMCSGCRIDESKDVIYFPRGGIRIEFRYRGRWYEVWSPDLP